MSKQNVRLATSPIRPSYTIQVVVLTELFMLVFLHVRPILYFSHSIKYCQWSFRFINPSHLTQKAVHGFLQVANLPTFAISWAKWKQFVQQAIQALCLRREMPLKKVKTLFSTKHKLEILVLCKWTVGYFINLLSEDSTSYLAGGGGGGGGTLWCW